MAYDAALDENGDLTANGTYVTGDELVAQSLGIALRQGFGEWPLDTTTGLPFTAWIERLPVPLDSIVARVASEIINTDGIIELTTIDGSFDSSTGTVNIEARARLASGSAVSIVSTLPLAGGSASIPNYVISIGSPRGSIAL